MFKWFRSDKDEKLIFKLNNELAQVRREESRYRELRWKNEESIRVLQAKLEEMQKAEKESDYAIYIKVAKEINHN